jgi:hypothetical protein
MKINSSPAIFKSLSYFSRCKHHKNVEKTDLENFKITPGINNTRAWP